MTTTNTKVQGTVDIEVIDKTTGEVIQHHQQTNTLTNAFLNAMLIDMLARPVSRNMFFNIFPANTHFDMYASALAGADNPLITTASPANMGLYVMGIPCGVTSETMVAPYLADDHKGLSKDVVWYNAGTSPSATEASDCIIPHKPSFHFDPATHTMSTVWVKNTGTGTIRSIIWGVMHGKQEDMIASVINPQNVNTGWMSDGNTTIDGYAVEFKTDDTIKWIGNSSEKIAYSLVSKTRMTAPVSSSPSTSANTRALVMNGHYFTMSRQTPANDTIPVQINVYPNWCTKSGSISSTPIALTFKAPEGQMAVTDVWPVFVARPQSNQIDVYMHTYRGTVGENTGCYIQKATIDSVALTATQPAFVGWSKYAIGNFSQTDLQYGFSRQGKIYLPYLGVFDGMYTQTASTTYMPGVILDVDLNEYLGGFLYSIAASSIASSAKGTAKFLTDLVWCVTEYGVQQVRMGTGTAKQLPYISMSQVMCGLDLTEPITKGTNDVVRLTYSFKLS